MNNLRIGVPSKGRLAEVAGELLKEAGLSFRRQERSLFARCREMPVDITFLRTEDIPVLCAEGAIDMGITGGDLVAESGAELIDAAGAGRRRSAGWRCACPTTATINTPGRARRHAASPPAFRTSPTTYLQQHGAKAHLVESVRLGRNHDRPGRGRRDRRPGRNRQHAGRQPAANARRDRPLRNGARAEPGSAGIPNWPTASCAGWKAW